jgi:hypothetical protein
MEIGILFLRRQIELGGKLDIFEGAVHSQTFVGIFLKGRFFFTLKLFGELAGNGFKQVLHGNHAQDGTEFVHDQSIIGTALTEKFDGIQSSGAVGQDERLA